METNPYLRALRQRWPLIVAVMLIGLVAGWFVKPSSKNYEATDSMILDQGYNNGDLSTAIRRIAYLTTAGDVPKRVASVVGGDPNELVKKIKAKADQELGILKITATDRNPQRAVQIADTFGNATLSSANDSANAQRQTQLDSLNNQANALQQQISQLEAGPQSATVQDQIGVLSQQYGQVYDQIRQLKQKAPDYGANAAGLSRVEKGRAVVANPPPSAKRRLAIGGFAGLLLGIGLALVLARFDPRFRTKEEVEEALALPVLAEVPELPRQQRKSHEIVTVAEPESLAAESYRNLRTALLVAPKRSHLTSARSARRSPPSHTNGSTRTVMVVSADVGDGKTTTVANLAAACAESNKNVIVIDCDLRRPEIHQYLDVEMQPGVTDVLDSGPADGAQGLGDALQPSVIPKVQVVASGRRVDNPGEVLSRGSKVLESASQTADVVLVDTAPILATDDVAALAARCDDVVVVCGAGRTTRSAARRTVERLTRLGASVAGVVLVRAETHPAARSYYRSYVGKKRRRDQTDQDDAAVPKDLQSSTPRWRRRH